MAQMRATRHGTVKKLKKDGKVRQSAQSNRVKIRKQITDLISDRDPDGSVSKGPLFQLLLICIDSLM